MTISTDTPAPGQGLDAAGALKRLAGNQKLYIRLLGQFQGSYAAVADEIKNLLDAGTLDAAERSAHTIKGLAGNLGTAGLQNAAATLEQLCRPGADTTARDAALEVFRRQLAETLAGITAYLAEQTSPAQAGAPQPGGVAPDKLRELIRYMREDDARACTLYYDLKPGIDAAYPSIAGSLEKAVDTFDFSEALAQINKVFPG